MTTPKLTLDDPRGWPELWAALKAKRDAEKEMIACAFCGHLWPWGVIPVPPFSAGSCFACGSAEK